MQVFLFLILAMDKCYYVDPIPLDIWLHNKEEIYFQLDKVAKHRHNHVHLAGLFVLQC